VTSCKRAAELTSRELDRPLPAVQRFALGFHRVMCAACRRFRTQLAEVDRAAGEFARAADGPDAALPADARERIRRALDAATAGG
jgi:predicted anti-sigma-YlaC factor YlaD